MQVIDLEHIKGSITVPELLDALGVDVQNDGKTECPWHEENTPSCHVYEDHLFCYGCGGSGDVVDVLKEYTGWPFVRCLHWLAEKAEDLPDVERVEKTKELPDLTKRFVASIVRETRAHVDFLVKQWPGVPRPHQGVWVEASFAGYMVPHWHDGRVVGVKVRGLDGSKSAWPGSVFTTQLYVARATVSPKTEMSPDRAVICEGESDSWAMASHTEDIDVYALPAGAGTRRDEWLKQLEQYRTVYICMDNDDAGRKARDKVARAVGHRRAIHFRPPTLYNDVNEACAAGWRPPLD